MTASSASSAMWKVYALGVALVAGSLGSSCASDGGSAFNEPAARAAFLAYHGYAANSPLSDVQRQALDDTIDDARDTWCDDDPLGMAVLINSADTLGGLPDAVRAGCPDQYAAGVALLEADA